MQLYRQQFSSMGCPCEIRLYANQAADAGLAINAAIDEVGRLDRKYSLYQDDSLLSQLNASAGSGQKITVDEETAALLDFANLEYEFSEGLFDITAGALWRVWDFQSGALPLPDRISGALEVTGWQKVEWKKPYLCLPFEGLTLDFGGIAKEYAADRAALILHEQGVQHGLVDLGGDFSTVGPHPGGGGWSIGIKAPQSPHMAMAIIELTAGGLATSGDYERCIEIDGTRYGHIINPKTGWPVQGFASISVQATSCLAAGAISTTAMLKGRPGGHDFLNGTELAFVSIDHNGQTLVNQR